MIIYFKYIDSKTRLSIVNFGKVVTWCGRYKKLTSDEVHVSRVYSGYFVK